MPAKRRAPTDGPSRETEPAPKRRSLRSSTRRDTDKEPLDDKATATAGKDSKTSKAKSRTKKEEKSRSTQEPASKTQSKSGSKASKPKPAGSGDITSNTTTAAQTSVTITSALLKLPITCQRYSNEDQDAGNEIPTLIFTHGAGGTLSAPGVVNFCTGYSTLQPIFAFQGSMNLAARVKGFHACISHLEHEEGNAGKGGKKLVLGGRSMGSRAAVMAASEHLATTTEKDVSVDLILVSYPLQGPKGDLRDQILFDLPEEVRVLFVVGDRDSMCPLDVLSKVRAKIKVQNWLVVVKGADHGMSKKGMGERGGRKAVEWVGGERWDAAEGIEV